MKTIKYFFLLGLLSVTAITCPALQPLDVAKAVEGYGKVVSCSTNKTGPRVIVIEESHVNVPVHLQEALILERLYKTAGLRQIGLEGFIAGEFKTNLDTKWYSSTTSKPAKRNEIATSFLEQAEINAAEFMKLVHDDVTLIPVERTEDYVMPNQMVDLDFSGMGACKMKLAELLAENPSKAYREKLASIYEDAAKSLRSQNFKGMTSFLSDFEEKQANAESDLGESLTDDEDLKKGIRMENAVSNQTNSSPSIESEIGFVEMIIQLANSKGLPFSAKELDDVQQYENYLKARANASATMVNQIVNWAVSNKADCYALIIGAGHSAKVVHDLAGKGVSYYLVHPSAMDDSATGFSDTGLNYEQKMKQKSIDSSALGGVLNQVYGRPALFEGSRANLKTMPKLVLNQEWFRAKSEAYMLVDAINAWNMEGRKTPFMPPRTEYVAVDLGSINEMKEQGDSVVQFRLGFLKNGEEKESVWVKAKAADGVIPSHNAEREVETLLKDAFERTRKSQRSGDADKDGDGGGTPKKSMDQGVEALVKDLKRAYFEQSQKRITESTVAVFAHAQEDLKQIEFTR